MYSAKPPASLLPTYSSMDHTYTFYSLLNFFCFSTLPVQTLLCKNEVSAIKGDNLLGATGFSCGRDTLNILRQRQWFFTFVRRHDRRGNAKSTGWGFPILYFVFDVRPLVGRGAYGTSLYHRVRKVVREPITKWLCCDRGVVYLYTTMILLFQIGAYFVHLCFCCE